jgi:cytochrome b561
MVTNPQQFPMSMGFFHWLVAAIVLTMLGIGVTMVVSLAHYHQLISIHRPLGTLLLILVAIRFVNAA